VPCCHALLRCRFDPRPRERGDIWPVLVLALSRSFDPRPARGATPPPTRGSSPGSRFDPRPRERGDWARR